MNVELRIKAVTEGIQNLQKAVSEMQKLEGAALQAASVNGFNKLAADVDKLTKSTGQAAKAHEKLGISAGQYSAAMRTLPAQFTDVATQLAGGQSPFLILLQQGGQIKDQFGGVGNAIRGIAAAISPVALAVGGFAAAAGGVAYAAYQGAKESNEFRTSLVMTGNIAGTTADNLSDIAAAIGKISGTRGNAAEVITDLVSTGKVDTDSLERFGKAAIDLERIVGQAAKDTVKAFAMLGEEPVKASLKLNDTLNYLTPSVYAQIKAFTENGQEARAAAVAQDAYANAVETMTAKLQPNLGALEKAWRAVSDAAKGAWDSMRGIGRDVTLSEQIAKQEKLVTALQTPSIDAFSEGGAGGIDVKALEAAQSQLAALRGQKDEVDKIARKDGERVQLNKDVIKAQDAQSKYNNAALTDHEKMNKALKDYRATVETLRRGGIAPSLEQQKKVENSIREQYSKSDQTDALLKAKVALHKAEIEATLAVLKDGASREEAVLKLAYEKGLVNLEEYFKQREFVQANAVAKEIAAKNQELADLQKEEKQVKGKNKQERELKILEIKQQQITVQKEIELLEGKALDITRNNAVEKQKALEAALKLRDAVNTQFATATGSFDRQATKNQIDDQFKAQTENANNLPPEERAAYLEKINLLKQVALAQAALSSLNQQQSLIDQQLAAQEKQVSADLVAGKINEQQAEQALNYLRGEASIKTGDLVLKMQALTSEFPAGTVAAQQFATGIANATTRVQELATQTDEQSKKIQGLLVNNIGNAIMSVINHTKTMKQAFKEMLANILSSILQSNINSALTSLFSVGGNGQNSGGGGFITSAIKSLFFADGGAVRGAGTATSDSIPAMLSNGEYVIPAKAVSRYGTGFFDAIRQMKLPKFADGGAVMLNNTQKAIAATAVGAAMVMPPITVKVINNGTPQNVTSQNTSKDTMQGIVLSILTEDQKNNGQVSRGQGS